MLKRALKQDRVSVSVATQKETQYILVPISVGNAKAKWSLGVNIPMEKVLQEPNRIFYTTMIMGNIAVLVLIGIVYLISGGISRPVCRDCQRGQQGRLRP